MVEVPRASPCLHVNVFGRDTWHILSCADVSPDRVALSLAIFLVENDTDGRALAVALVLRHLGPEDPNAVGCVVEGAHVCFLADVLDDSHIEVTGLALYGLFVSRGGIGGSATIAVLVGAKSDADVGTTPPGAHVVVPSVDISLPVLGVARGGEACIPVFTLWLAIEAEIVVKALKFRRLVHTAAEGRRSLFV